MYDTWQSYFYPETYNPATGQGTLRNLYGERDAVASSLLEYAYTLSRARNLTYEIADVERTFDAAHLRAIHRYLFQDVFEWAGRACQFFCVWGLEVGGDSVGVGGGELGEGLFPVGGGVSLDEAGVSCSFVGGFASVCEALGGSFVFDVADGEP